MTKQKPGFGVSGGESQRDRIIADMNSDNKRGKNLWLIFTILFLLAAGGGLAVLYNYYSNRPDSPPAAAEQPAPVPQFESVPEAGADTAPAEPALSNQAPAAAVQTSTAEEAPQQAGHTKAPIQIGDIYQDPDGVWRNRDRKDDYFTANIYKDENGVWRARKPEPAPTRRTAARRTGETGETGAGSMGLLDQIGPVISLLGGGSDGAGDSGGMSLINMLLGSGQQDGGSLIGSILGGDAQAAGELMNNLLGGGLGNIFEQYEMPEIYHQTPVHAPASIGQPAQAPKAAQNAAGPISHPLTYEKFDPSKPLKVESGWEQFERPR